MNVPDLVRVLEGLPETRLRLIDLAWEVVDDEGAIDPDKVALNYKEISEAMDEAQAYAQATEKAVLCLNVLARSND